MLLSLAVLPVQTEVSAVVVTEPVVVVEILLAKLVEVDSDNVEAVVVEMVVVAVVARLCRPLDAAWFAESARKMRNRGHLMVLERENEGTEYEGGSRMRVW